MCRAFELLVVLDAGGGIFRGGGTIYNDNNFKLILVFSHTFVVVEPSSRSEAQVSSAPVSIVRSFVLSALCDRFVPVDLLASSLRTAESRVRAPFI